MASSKALKQAMEEVEETATAQTSAQPPLWDEPATESAPRAPMPPSDASSNVREKGTGRKLIKMFVGSDTEDFESDDEEDEGPAKPIRFIGPPAKYRLDRAPYHCMMIHRHVFIKEPTHWDVNVKVLFDK